MVKQMCSWRAALQWQGMMELAEAVAAASMRAAADVHSARDRQRVPTCESGVQCGAAAAEAAVQTEPPPAADAAAQTEAAGHTTAVPSPHHILPASPCAPMSARELQRELAKVTITPTRLSVGRPLGLQRPLLCTASSTLSDKTILPLNSGAGWCGGNEGLARPGSPSREHAQPPTTSAACKAEEQGAEEEEEEWYGTPLGGNTPASGTPLSSAVPAGSALQPLPCGGLLANISAHPSFQAEVDEPAAATGGDCWEDSLVGAGLRQVSVGGVSLHCRVLMMPALPFLWHAH